VGVLIMEAVRKIRGGVYTFKSDYSIVEGKEIKYVKCITPENSFGYPDIVLLSSKDRLPYTLLRYMPKNILVTVGKYIKKFEKEWFCDE
jgi:hypothetical protein